jgi:uncharacterized protein with HEPN domain
MSIGIGDVSSSHDPAVCLAEMLDNIERTRSYVGAMDRDALERDGRNGFAKLRFAWATKPRG